MDIPAPGRLWRGACLCIALLFVAPVSNPALAVLVSDGNSTMDIDLATGTVTSWVVDGVEQLGLGVQHLYRVGTGGGESPVGDLDLFGSAALPNGGFAVRYDDPGSEFQILMNFDLTGGAVGSGDSTLLVTSSIEATGLANVDMHYFEFADLNLTGTAAGDSATISVDSFVVSAMQSDAQTTYEQRLSGNLANAIDPSGYEVGEAAALSADFADGLDTNLGMIGGAVTADAAFAVQYDFLLVPGGNPSTGSLVTELSTIGLNDTVIPEPASALLAMVGLGTLGLRARRRGQIG